MPRPTPAGLDLGAELHELAQAVGAARLLAEALLYHQMPDEEAERAAPGSIAGVLSMVGVRLRDLGRCLRFELNPALLVAPYNRADDVASSDSIVLPVWDEAQQEADAQRVLRRVQAQRQAKKRSTKTTKKTAKGGASR